MRRVAVITGASAGIGEAIARRLPSRIWLPVLVARREDRLRALAEELDGEYEVCDIGDREAIERMAAAVLERHPAIAMLVNNAGMPGRGDFTDLDPERIERVTRVNYLGAVWATRAFLPALEAGRPVAHRQHRLGRGHRRLGACRAVHGLEARRARLLPLAGGAARAPSGISVHTVNPGFVETGDVSPERPAQPVLRRLVVGARRRGSGGHARDRARPPRGVRAALVPDAGDRPGGRSRAAGPGHGPRRLPRETRVDALEQARLPWPGRRARQEVREPGGLLVVERDRSLRGGAPLGLPPDAEAHVRLLAVVARDPQRPVGVDVTVAAEELDELQPLRRRTPGAEAVLAPHRPPAGRARTHTPGVYDAGSDQDELPSRAPC